MSTLETRRVAKSIWSYTNFRCVGALVSEHRKTIYLFHTENLSLYLAEIFTKVKSKKHSSNNLYRDRNKLRLIILETCPGEGGDERWDLHYWYEYYKSHGYSFYNEDPPITIIPIITVTSSGVLVQLRNKAYNRFTIGVFSTMVEAEEFVNDNYTNPNRLGAIASPVWAANSMTIQYFNK